MPARTLNRYAALPRLRSLIEPTRLPVVSGNPQRLAGRVVVIGLEIAGAAGDSWFGIGRLVLYNSYQAATFGLRQGGSAPGARLWAIRRWRLEIPWEVCSEGPP